MKIILIGSNGQLGTDIIKVFCRYSTFNLIPLTHKNIDITNYSRVRHILNSHKPDCVINTAAFHKVESCEKDLQTSFLVNASAIYNLALKCAEKDILLVHFSTDYVFGGDDKRNKPYSENDIPCPINAYGISKLAGEYFVRHACKKYFLIRTSGLFGAAGASSKGANFIETMMQRVKIGNAKVVKDQILSPTYTVDLAENIRYLIKTRYYGLYHMTSKGQCSWYDFAQEIFRLTKSKVKLDPVCSNYFSSPVRRPHYSVLANTNLTKINLNKMRHWKISLKKYLIEKGYI